MGIPVLILGKSGSGKSASLRNFPESGVINVLGKPFPFRGKVNSIVSREYGYIKRVIQASKANSIVIDDAGYLITDQFMMGHANAGGGNSVFSLYNDIGDQFYQLVQFVVQQLPPDRIVYFIMHEDKNDSGDIKPKTIGKLLDEKVCVEGMFTIVLRCTISGERHVFLTQSNGYDIQKTPMGMFESMEIDNDLKMVDDTIREYWNLGGSEA